MNPHAHKPCLKPPIPFSKLPPFLLQLSIALLGAHGRTFLQRDYGGKIIVRDVGLCDDTPALFSVVFAFFFFGVNFLLRQLGVSRFLMIRSCCSKVFPPPFRLLLPWLRGFYPSRGEIGHSLSDTMTPSF